MRICLATSSFLPMVGGAEIVVHNLATALTTLGHEVTVLVPRYSRAFRSMVPYRLHPVLAGTFPLLARSARLGAWYLLPSLARLRWWQVDVVNAHFTLPLGPALIRHKRMLAAPVVITFHGTDIQKDPSIGYGLRLDGRIEERIRGVVNAADAVVAISASVRGSALELMERPDRIFDIPNGVDLGRFSPAGPRGQFRRRLGIPDRVPLILAVGRNHQKKGFRFLVEAMRRVAAAHPAARCVILGRGGESLRSLAASLGVSQQVLAVDEIGFRAGGAGPLTFPSEEIVEAYRDSDVFVSPSLIEGCSLSVLEALASGLPVLATDAPGNRDAIEHGYNGLTCRPRDADDLAAQLLTLLSDRPLRERLAGNARASAKQYDWLEIGRRYLEMYRQPALIAGGA